MVVKEKLNDWLLAVAQFLMRDARDAKRKGLSVDLLSGNDAVM